MNTPTKQETEKAKKILAKKTKMVEKIKEIINFFNKLPGFEAYDDRSNTDFPGSIICVDINSGYPQKNPDNTSWFRMYLDDEVRFYQVLGEPSNAYSKWLEKVLKLEKEEKLTWKKFYECCLELGGIYTKIPKIN